jgi:hypothetical protein
MKTSSSVLSLMLIVFTCCIVIAQDKQTSTGRIPNLKLESNHVSSGIGENLATIGYGYSPIQSSTLSMPIPAGTPFTLLAPFTFYLGGLASSMCKGENGNYYITHYEYSGAIPSLYQLNIVTGDITLVGSIWGMGYELPNGISYNPTDSTYYICSSAALYSIDINTLFVTRIGSFGILGGAMIDLCFDANGVCFAYDVGLDNAYTLDVYTATPTLLGPLGYSANYVQGMSYDYETNTIYLSAFNSETQTGQLRTMDPTTGYTSLLTDWGYDQIASFALDSNPGPPCPISAPTNPNPPNGSTSISPYNTSLNWINGAGTTNVELWFGPQGSVVQLYDGPAITSWETDSLTCQTTYQWRVVCKNDTCSTYGPFWSFLTELDSATVFFEQFNNTSGWIPIGPFGTTSWYLSNTTNAGGSPPSEVRFSGSDSYFLGLSQFLSPTINDSAYHYIVRLRHGCVVQINSPIADLGLAISYDGGVTKQIIWQIQFPGGNVGPEPIEAGFYPELDSFQLVLFFDGWSGEINNWYIDDILVIGDCPPCFPPPAPYNLNARNISYPDPRVLVFWSDSAWNEDAFNIIRKNGQPNDPDQYQLIGTVPFNRTHFRDSTVITDSIYTYGVIAYNQYGYSDTSNTVTILAEPIPVELTSFYSEIKNEIVTLHWETATETNNLGFEIERKQKDSEWRTIGFKEGKGTTTEKQSYSFIDKNISTGNYLYRLKQIDYDGSFEYSDILEVEAIVIHHFSVEQNYPNPFNPTTKIKFTIPTSPLNPSPYQGEGQRERFITLIVYDVLGNKIATLVNQEKPAGSYEVEFSGTTLPSGIYFYQIKVGSFIQTRKMVLMK